MATYKRIRALSRALVVLEHLNRVGESSSNAVATALGLPKTTSYRMLKCLMDCDLAYYSPSRNGFRLTPRMAELSPRDVATTCINGVIEPALHDLSLHILWPCAFSVFENGSMVSKARTHRKSPLTLLSDLHIRRDVFASGAGLAYLAFLDPEEQTRSIETIEMTQGPADPTQKAGLGETLARVRSCGYALEREGQNGELAALAVPIRNASGPIGCLHTTWIPSAHDTDALIIERVLPHLLMTRDNVEEALARRQ